MPMPLFPPALQAPAQAGSPLPTPVAQAGPSVPVMAASEIRVGMKGAGRTVWQGGKIDSFQFEVIGIMRNSAPGRTRILVRASGGPLAESGIIQGMSGSPCYIDGKLVGALSFGFGNQKEPIGGITPILEMLDQLKDLPEVSAQRTPLILPKLEPPKVLKSALSGQMLPISAMGDFDPQALPLVLSGSSFGEAAQTFWKDSGVRFVAAGSSGSAAGGEASPMEPGGMIAVNLVQGDLDMSASGTITYVEKKRVLCFGHPMFNLGGVDLPMWSATVATVMPSYAMSFKLSTPVAPVGALRLDRSSGIVGVLGAEARMVPLRLGLNLGGKRNLNFKFEIMDHPMITPVLAATVLAQTLDTHSRGLGFQSLSLQGNIKVAGHPPIQIENMVADLNPGRLSQYLGAMLQGLTFNPFERPVIEGISLTVKAEERLDLTAVAGVRILKARAKRGEVLPVLVTLQNIQGVRETATFNVQVPMSAEKGKAVLMVGDGLSLMATDPDERSVEVTNLGDVVRLLNGAMRNNHVYALLMQTHTGVGLRGARIEGVPPAVATLAGLEGPSSSSRLQRRIIGRAYLPLEREVKGLSQIEVEIE
ncbi:MAG TPA: SpoIVB peptidase S55 domain-containing protein [Holophagaceae bacterium]|nr:SpoIVB peptidase S55 domain-containing protein [Holophagaceae bacterium]